MPIAIHLLNRRTNRVIEWGAMDFIFQSLIIRNRRIQLEEALLMAARCLLLGLLALALARPFVPPGSSVPWLIILPLILLAIVGLGVATVLQNERKWRLWLFSISAFILVICGLLIFFEKQLNLNRFGGSGRQDIAIIIDGSTSMSMEFDGLSNFQRAVDEAREVIKRAPRGHAFSLIIAGPSPSAKILDPSTDRAELNAMLDEARPLDGSMAAYHSLTLASLSLARGDNPSKQILLFTDGQNVGWKIDQTGQWDFLRDAFRNLSSEPKIILRQLPLPKHIRNIAIIDLSFSRNIVGVDRPVTISVSVENTGNESITPASLDLIIEGKTLNDNSLGQIAPGATTAVTFTHRFQHSGAHSIEAKLTVDDEIVQDNVRHYALNIVDSLKVLLVDGRPDGRFLERAASFPALALAPIKRPQGSTSDQSDQSKNDPTRFLVDPTVVSAAKISSIPNLDNYDVIILADVPRLPKTTAKQMAAFVHAGGGLMVSLGQRAQASFYNSWQGSDGQALLPAGMADTLSIADEKTPIHPSVSTLRHPALQKFAKQDQSDFSTTTFDSYWKLQIPDSQRDQIEVGARLNNGAPYLVARRYGNGRVLQLASSLDNSTSNLPTRHSYLPFIHELVYYLADPAAWDLNLDAAWELTLHLPTHRGSKDAQVHLSWQSPSLRHEIIPAKNLRVFTSNPASKSTGPSLATYSIIGPDGLARQGKLSSAEGGAFIHVQGDIFSGLYQVEVPDAQKNYFKTLLAPGSKTIPFTVKRNPDESRLVQLSDDDFSFLKNYITFIDTDTAENVLKILNGSSFGRELWKYLAVGAFLILLIEIALSRWIARERRTGEEVTIEFESNHAPSDGFKEQLAKVSKLQS